jgi:predicted nucleotidyltransferase
LSTKNELLLQLVIIEKIRESGVIMLSDQTKEQLVKMIGERTNAEFILLFGSHAKETARKDSDIDIAYYSEDLLSPFELFSFLGELAQIGNKDVDLVNIREIDTVFAMQIFTTGKLLECKNENEFVKQRMKAFSMYAGLNQQRAEVLQSIQDRGSVFGNE